MPPNVVLAYKAALNVLTSRLPFEEKVADSHPVDAELLQHYLVLTKPDHYSKL